MWLRDYHFDGLRLDAVHAIVDDSAMHILEQLANEVDALAAHVRRPLFLVAESDLNDPRFVRGRDVGGYGMDAPWADELHHALHAALTGRGEWLLRGLRVAAPAGQGAAPGVGVRRHVFPAPPAPSRPAAGGLAGQPFVGLYPEPRPGRQPRGRRTRLAP